MAFCLLGMSGEATEPTGREGFVSIFNGTSLDGWEGKPDFWRVKDGCIVGETTAENPTKGNTFLIWRQGIVDDFELVLQYRILSGNSGIQYRSKDYGDFVVGGYQGDFEFGPTFSGILYEERGRGILANRGERVTVLADGTKKQGEAIGATAELQKVIKQGDWNEYRIVAQGAKLQHFVNGQLMSETIDDQGDKRSMQGLLALQLHAGPPMKVEFKNIRLKRLKPAAYRTKIVIVAGCPSHPPGQRGFRAGATLVQKCLIAGESRLVTAPVFNGGLADPALPDTFDALARHGARMPVEVRSTNGT